MSIIYNADKSQEILNKIIQRIPSIITIANLFYTLLFQVSNHFRLSSIRNPELMPTRKFHLHHTIATENGTTATLGICRPGNFGAVRVGCGELMM